MFRLNSYSRLSVTYEQILAKMSQLVTEVTNNFSNSEVIVMEPTEVPDSFFPYCENMNSMLLLQSKLSKYTHDECLHFLFYNLFWLYAFQHHRNL